MEFFPEKYINIIYKQTFQPAKTCMENIMLDKDKREKLKRNYSCRIIERRHEVYLYGVSNIHTALFLVDLCYTDI